MEKSVTTKQIVFLLKKLLKKHGYNYSDLAEILAISEASAKRIMSQGDFSLKRLEKISEWFGLDFFDFLDKAKSVHLEPYEFSSEQEEALVRDPNLLYTMILLSVGYTVSDLSAKLNKEQKPLDRILQQLDKIGLIELHANRKIKLMVRAPFRMKKRGQLHQAYYDKFVNKACEHLRQYNSEDQLIVSEFYMSDNLLQKMRKEVSEVHSKYMDLARMEQEVVDVSNFKPVTEIIFNTNQDSWKDVLIPSKTFPDS